MLLLLTGVLLTLTGCLAGALLAWTQASLPDPDPSSLTLWVLFPLFGLLGHALAVRGARLTQWHGLAQGLGVLHLMLALSCAVGLLFNQLGWWHSATGPLGLWYVLGLAGVPGLLSTLAPHLIHLDG